MLAPIADYVPIKVNIRFITRETNHQVEESILSGPKAPPPTPLIPLRSGLEQSNFSETSRKNNSDVPIKPIEVKQLQQLTLSKENLISSDEACVSDNASAATSSSKSEDYLQPGEKELLRPFCELISQRQHLHRLNKHHRKIRRKTTVVSPFSERCVEKKPEINPICQLMPLQTTGGYFKGRPPLTQAGRLGCLSVQSTAYSRLRPVKSKEELNKFARCYTADVPRISKASNSCPRPVSHSPTRNDLQKTFKPHLPTSTTQESKNKGDETFSFYNTGLPLTETNRNKQDMTIQIKNELPRIFQLTDKHRIKATSRRDQVINSNDKHYNTMHCRKIAVTQIAPFRRNLKISSF